MPIAEWTNWSGRQRSTPARRLAVGSEAELVAAVRAAGDEGLTVRAVGASHSHSRVAVTEGVVLDTDALSGLVGVDVDASVATVRAGTRIFALGPLLHEHGLALRNQGDIDKQSVAGAVSTGTHGTGPSLQNLSASVRAARIVLAGGDVVTTSPDAEPELFELARHSLGGVGVLSEVTLAVRPAYRLHERQWKEPPAEVFARIDALIGATRHFEFFWDPVRDVCFCKSLTETDAPPDALGDRPWERIGWSHEIISSVRDVLHTEMEYSVPAEIGPAAFEAVRSLIRADFPALTWPVEYRTLAADDLWISTASGRDTVTISVHEGVENDETPLFRACEAVLRRFEGRPHWGKVHYRSGRELAALYDEFGRWWQLRDRFDPNGVFHTPALAALRP
ncbi:MAG: FAD-binding protein [Acidimicrobiia bacterium]|nr:FAD-binding protein [Acidimicrobiia bacterium]